MINPINTIAYLENKLFSKKHQTDLFVKFASSIFDGVIGSVLLVSFTAGLISLDGVLKLLPWIIAFNAALTGYTLLDKTKDRMKHKKICAAGSGVVGTILTWALLNIMFFYFSSGYLLDLADLMQFMLIGGILSLLGAVLAIKYLNLG